MGSFLPVGVRLEEKGFFFQSPPVILVQKGCASPALKFGNMRLAFHQLKGENGK